MNVKFSKAENVSRYLDLYRPPNETENPELNVKTSRAPNPARLLIVSTRSERGNLFKVEQLLNQKLGNVNRPEISRFGRKSFLVHAKSHGQAVMLLNMRLESEGLIKEIKHHFHFSYARGVIFSEDL